LITPEDSVGCGRTAVTGVHAAPVTPVVREEKRAEKKRTFKYIMSKFFAYELQYMEDFDL